jgi:hypothetical protein
MEEMRSASKILVGKPEGKRPLGRYRHKWADNNKKDLKEIGYEDVDWIHQAQNKHQKWDFVNMVMNFWNP